MTASGSNYTDKHSSEILVIGSGIAGLIAALELSQFSKVSLLAKKSLSNTATNWAQGGIASVSTPEDSVDSHLKDTLRAGAGLGDPDLIRSVAEEGQKRIQNLIDFGVRFSKGENASFDLTREGGHSHRRIYHADDFTGQEIQRALLEKVKNQQNIEIFENHIAIDLILREKKCVGAYALNEITNKITTISSFRTVLATGGAGRVYLYSSNPDTATGDGIAMAYRAGCRIGNMEFMQFHPTCLFHPKEKTFLISEALRGEGARLKTVDNDFFMARYDSREELASRDIVARAIDREMKVRGHRHVLLDCTKLGETFLRERFPNIFNKCFSLGINIAKESIPVVPAAHYTCGGVLTNSNGKTTVENLYAIGETAFTGLHGANRLASNSLLEGAVFGYRAAQDIKDSKKKEWKEPGPLPVWEFGRSVIPEERVNIAHNWDEVRHLMWNYVGIVRTDNRLQRAFDRVRLLQREIAEYYWGYLPFPDLIELRNLTQVAQLIIQSALLRKESRGLHFNLDYPDQDDQFFKKNTIL
jgi:L-aspartate oxidase